jgi:hypothetical protein
VPVDIHLPKTNAAKLLEEILPIAEKRLTIRNLDEQLG